MVCTRCLLLHKDRAKTVFPTAITYRSMSQNDVVSCSTPCGVYPDTPLYHSGPSDHLCLDPHHPLCFQVDFLQMPVNTLRRYKRHYKLQTRPGLNKSQLAEVSPLREWNPGQNPLRTKPPWIKKNLGQSPLDKTPSKHNSIRT